jgi:hypothetical protein
MASRLSRRLSAFLCAGLLALTVLVGTVVTLPLRSPSFASSDYPPGPSIKSAFQSHSGSGGSAVVLPHGIIIPG